MSLTYFFLSVSPLWILDCPDSAGGGGGVLPVLASSPCCSPLGGVWDLPPKPGLFRVKGGRPLPGIQQLIRQPGHLCFPVGEFQEGVQAGVQVPDRYQ